MTAAPHCRPHPTGPAALHRQPLTSAQELAHRVGLPAVGIAAALLHSSCIPLSSMQAGLLLHGREKLLIKLLLMVKLLLLVKLLVKLLLLLMVLIKWVLVLGQFLQRGAASAPDMIGVGRGRDAPC